MLVIVLSFLSGVVFDKLVRCGIRCWRNPHYLDPTPAEAWQELRRIYGRAADECFLENARHAARRAVKGIPHNATPDFSDIYANDLC